MRVCVPLSRAVCINSGAQFLLARVRTRRRGAAPHAPRLDGSGAAAGALALPPQREGSSDNEGDEDEEEWGDESELSSLPDLFMCPSGAGAGSAKGAPEAPDGHAGGDGDAASTAYWVASLQHAPAECAASGSGSGGAADAQDEAAGSADGNAAAAATAAAAAAAAVAAASASPPAPASTLPLSISVVYANVSPAHEAAVRSAHASVGAALAHLFPAGVRVEVRRAEEPSSTHPNRYEDPNEDPDEGDEGDDGAWRGEAAVPPSTLRARRAARRAGCLPAARAPSPPPPPPPELYLLPEALREPRAAAVLAHSRRG
jgi:hypothetical protein